MKVKLTVEEDSGTVGVELCVPSQPADVKMEDGDVKMEEAGEPAEEASNRASSQQTATTSGRDYVPGTYHFCVPFVCIKQHVKCETGVVALLVKASRGCGAVTGESTDLSFLDPINRADTPPRAIQLAAAELSLRIEQNRQRLNTGLGNAVDTITRRRMCGKVGAVFYLHGLPAFHEQSMVFVYTSTSGSSRNCKYVFCVRCFALPNVRVRGSGSG